MENEKIEIIDESGDRDNFTIIPNFILNHSTANAQALYLQLKRLAGDKGSAYPSSRYLRDKLKISQPTLRKEIKYLLDKSWIKYAGEKEVMTDGGVQKIKSYKIVNLWDLNNKFYSKKRGENIDIPSERGEKIAPQGVKTRGEKIAYNKDPLDKDPSSNKIETPSVSLNDLIDLFKNVNPSYGKFFKNTTQRFALQRLVKQWGEEKVRNMIATLQETNSQEYAPTITTPLQLEDKLGSLIAFINKRKNKLPGIIKI